MTSGENSGLAIGIAMGTLAILVGFFGLLMLFRIRPQTYAAPPPVRRDAIAPAPAAATVAPPRQPEPVVAVPIPVEPAPTHLETAPDAAVAEPPPPPAARKPRAKRAPKLHVVPPPPEQRLELEAPDEVLELPASGTPDEPSEDQPAKS